MSGRLEQLPNDVPTHQYVENLGQKCRIPAEITNNLHLMDKISSSIYTNNKHHNRAQRINESHVPRPVIQHIKTIIKNQGIKNCGLSKSLNKQEDVKARDISGERRKMNTGNTKTRPVQAIFNTHLAKSSHFNRVMNLDLVSMGVTNINNTGNPNLLDLTREMEEADCLEHTGSNIFPDRKLQTLHHNKQAYIAKHNWGVKWMHLPPDKKYFKNYRELHSENRSVAGGGGVEKGSIGSIGSIGPIGPIGSILNTSTENNCSQGFLLKAEKIETQERRVHKFPHILGGPKCLSTLSTSVATQKSNNLLKAIFKSLNTIKIGGGVNTEQTTYEVGEDGEIKRISDLFHPHPHPHPRPPKHKQRQKQKYRRSGSSGGHGSYGNYAGVAIDISTETQNDGENMDMDMDMDMNMETQEYTRKLVEVGDSKLEETCYKGRVTMDKVSSVCGSPSQTRLHSAGRAHMETEGIPPTDNAIKSENNPQIQIQNPQIRAAVRLDGENPPITTGGNININISHPQIIHNHLPESTAFPKHNRSVDYTALSLNGQNTWELKKGRPGINTYTKTLKG